MVYTVRISNRAARELKKIDAKDRPALIAEIDQLKAEPLPHGVKKIAGGYDLHRIRVGNHRIVYRIEDAQLIILVVRIGHRREVYRRLEDL